MDTELEDRLTATLRAVADQTASPTDWNRVMTEASTLPLGSAETGEPRAGIWRLPAVAVILALALAGLGLLGVLWPRANISDPVGVTTVNHRLVLPGEVVVQADPLIVVAAPGPEPLFDTSGLGTEISFKPIEAVDDQIQAQIDQELFWVDPGTGPMERSLTKATLIGRIDGATEPWLITVTDGPNTLGVNGESADQNLRQRTVVGGNGGAVGARDLAPIDSLEMIEPPAIDSPEWGNGASYASPEGWLSLEPLPAEVAVVTFADEDERFWMRPRGGVAAFYGRFDDGESFTLTALDADGEPIRSFTQIVTVDDEPDLSPAATIARQSRGGIWATLPIDWVFVADDPTPSAGLNFHFAAGTYPLPAGGGGGCGHLPIAAINALGPDDVFLHLEEFPAGTSLSGVEPKPDRFAPELTGIDDGDANTCADNRNIGTLRTVTFHEDGRSFHLLVVIGNRASASVMAEAAAVIDQLDLGA